ncbi:MAG: putative addiction module antidote protein [Rickettsiales bacterium]|jgi:probable addiction module antidote protein|nr:putative addiction module antidote protein [Rickettsiales bacterium]
MKKKITVRKWDAAEHLHNENDYAAYLAAAFEDGDPVIIRSVMADVARARNMSAIARDMGISTRGLYKMLSENGNPEFSTVQKFLHAIGVRISVIPAQEHKVMAKTNSRQRLAA